MYLFQIISSRMKQTVESTSSSYADTGEDSTVNKVEEFKALPDESDAIIAAQVAGVDVMFIVDSGAQVNTLTRAYFERILAEETSASKLYDLRYATDKSLKAYASKGEIQVIATFSAELFISEDRPVFIEKFYVVDEVKALLGFNTSARYSVLAVGLKVPVGGFNLWPCELLAISASEQFPRFNVPPVSLSYNKEMPPARNVFTFIPPAYKERTKQKLAELLSSGIIEAVSPDMDRSFCSSLLVVPKGKEDIRLVIDLRGPNRCINRTPFKMPTFESILLELHDAKWFSTIDLTNAFFHVELDESSRHLTNFFTGDGVYRYCRLPFGLCNAPDIFQEILQSIVLTGCRGTVNYLDDILVSGKTKEEHDANLKIVMDCLKNHNVKINMDKCSIGKTSVKFLGFVISADGWSVENEKVKALQSFRRPQTQAEVKSFLGLVNYIEKFIFNRADRTWRLRELAKSEKFYWSEDLEMEFEFLKHEAWKTVDKLGYYSCDDETELFVDASPYGLGAVLVQYNSELNPRVIACASKALSIAEKKYPQTQKEALAMVWGVERFSMYLMSKRFVIRSDAESNEFIFNGLHRIGKRAVSRAEAWALRLQPYNFKVEKIPGEMNVADALSRLLTDPQPEESFDDTDEKHLLFYLDSGSMDIRWSDIEKESEEDQELINVRTALLTGQWTDGLRAYESQAKYLHSLGPSVFKGEY